MENTNSTKGKKLIKKQAKRANKKQQKIFAETL